VSTNNRGTSENDHLRCISERLTQRTAVIESRMRKRMESVRLAYDLDARALLSSHRQVKELSKFGAAPSPIEFWGVTANPRGQALVHAASAVIDDELRELDRALERFRRSIVASAKHPAYEPEVFRAVLAEQLERLAACQMDPGPINKLGARWQGRLRRAAALSLYPRLLFVSANQSDPLIAQAEMALLDAGPWAHDDRLLSAFELAHADVRVYLREQLGDRSVVVPSRPSRKLVTPG
jgi:hypothetical protein